MNRRLLLLLVLAALGAAAWWLSSRSTGSTLDPTLSDFAIADTARVTRIHISDRKGKTIDLRRTRNGWNVNGSYRARQPEVSTLLNTFKRIEVKSPVPKSAEETALRAMAASSIKVEIYTGGAEPEKIWIVGHDTKDQKGTHMVLELPGVGRSSAPFIMGMQGFIGILNTRFPTDPDNWRSSSVFSYPDLHALASVEVEHVARPDASYRIDNRLGATPLLLAPSGAALPMDTVLVQAALLPYKEFNYDHIMRDVAPAMRDSLLAAAPNFVITATGRDGAAQSMRLWYMANRSEDPGFDTPRPLHDPVRMWAVVQDSLLVAVQRQYVDIMTQPASAFRP